MTDGLWHSMPLKRNCFLSITIYPLLMPVELNGIEVPGLVLVFLVWSLLNLWTGSHIYSPLPRLLQGMWAPFRAQHSLILNPSFINQPFKQLCSIVPSGVVLQGPCLLDWVQKWVVSSGLSAGLPALSHRRDVASLVQEVLLWEMSRSLQISYLPNTWRLKALTFLRRCMVIQLILLCAGISCINQSELFTLHTSPLELRH